VRASTRGRFPEANAPQHRLDVIPERHQSRREQRVVLKTEPAATLAHELALEIAELERCGHAAQRIEVLERDRNDVRAV
jgi:hypothetical protein